MSITREELQKRILEEVESARKSREAEKEYSKYLRDRAKNNLPTCSLTITKEKANEKD